MAGGDLGSAHPTCQQRFAFHFRQCLDSLGGLGGIGHVLRGEDDEYAVVGGIVSYRFDCLGEPLGGGVAEDVDWIIVAPLRREERV